MMFVPGLAGMELIFFTAAGVVLCSGFVAKTMLETCQCSALANHACTESRFSLLLSPSPTVGRGGTQADV